MTEPIDAGLRRAIDEMVSSTGRQTLPNGEGMVFLGAWHDAYPSILIRDRSLTDGAKVLYLYLCQEARHRPYGAVAMPPIAQIGVDLGRSKVTLIRDLRLLRVTRWASLCQRVRDSTGRFRGNIYAIHSEPCSLAETLQLDEEYMSLVEGWARSSKDPALGTAARAVSAAIDEDIAAGRNPLAPVDPVAQRREAAATLGQDVGRFFAVSTALLVQQQNRTVQNFSSSESETANSQSDTPGTVQNLYPVSLGTEARVQNFSQGGLSALPPSNQVQNLNLVGQPGTNFVPGNQPNENNRKKGFPLGFSAATPGRGSKSVPGSSSSSIYIHTTTRGNPSEFSSVDVSALSWPREIHDNAKRLAIRAMHSVDLSADNYQIVVNALAWRLRNPSKPIADCFSYTLSLCQRAKSGTLNAVPTSERPEGLSAPSASTHLAQVRAEIDALERLVAANSTPPQSRDILRRQIDSLKAQLKPT